MTSALQRLMWRATAFNYRDECQPPLSTTAATKTNLDPNYCNKHQPRPQLPLWQAPASTLLCRAATSATVASTSLDCLDSPVTKTAVFDPDYRCDERQPPLQLPLRRGAPASTPTHKYASTSLNSCDERNNLNDCDEHQRTSLNSNSCGDEQQS